MDAISSTATKRSARVFVDYKATSPPPHPGNGWTRFVCLSDTHSRLFPVPPGDVLLHSGDLSSWGYPEQVDITLDWLQTLDHPVKIIIASNHDLCLDPDLGPRDQVMLQDPQLLESVRQRMKSKDVRDANIHYLQHESLLVITTEGREWLVYGSPSAPRYARGAFQYDSEDEANDIYRRIPLETEILLTHTPPHLVLDTTKRGMSAGCPYLAARMQELSQCRLHVFGHIHESWGAKLSGYDELGPRVSVNAAVDRRGSQAIIVDLQN